MDTAKLERTVQEILAPGKGILAIDESPENLNRKLKSAGIPQTEDNLKMFREVMLSTPKINEHIGGVILHMDTFHQKTSNGTPFLDILKNNNIHAGIKLDRGLMALNTVEKFTAGLDTLKEVLDSKIYAKASFAKWRTVFVISETTPSESCMQRNLSDLAEYAILCQKAGLVPIVEPEILTAGNFSIRQAKHVAKKVLSMLTHQLSQKGVFLRGTILKPAFITQGRESTDGINHSEVAQMTQAVLLDSVPSGIGGIAFLSGGHTPVDCFRFLSSLACTAGNKPWPLTFSFGRALSNCVLDLWRGGNKGVEAAQQAFQKKTYEATLAVQGNYASFEADTRD